LTNQEYIYFMGTETSASLRYKLLTEIIKLSLGVFLKWLYLEVKT